MADGSTDTPVKTAETDGDQERLISRPGEGRGRRPPRERLSWPKFQAMKRKHRPGPRRSHSSSEAYERGKAQAASPTSSDTEAQLAAEEQGRKAGPGGQRRSRVLSLGFRLGAGKGLSLAGRPGTGAPGGGVRAGVLQEEGTRDDSQRDAGAAARVGTDGRAGGGREGTPRRGAEAPGALARSPEGALGRGADAAPRRPRRTQEVPVQEEVVSQVTPEAGSGPGQGRSEGVQAREMGGAVPCLQGTPVEGDMHDRQPDFRVRIPNLKVPRFGISKGTELGKEGERPAQQGGPRRHGPATGAAERGGQSADADAGLDTAAAGRGPRRERAGAGKAADGIKDEATEGDAEDANGKQQTVTVLGAGAGALGGSPGQDTRERAEKQGQKTDVEERRP